MADERLQSVIELAADFYWEQDEHFRFTAYRPASEPDPTLDGLIGQTSWEFFSESLETGGWAQLMVTLEQHAPFRDVLHALGDSAGGTRYLSFSGQPIFDQRNKFKGYRGIARDVSSQIRAERSAMLERTIALTLAEADDVAEGLNAVIRVMCEAQGWTAGNFWSVDAQRDTLWHEVGWNADGEDRRSVLNVGDRLPHWLSHGPVWIGDVIRDPRTSRLDRVQTAGWNTGLVIPVKIGGTTLGVLDFYAPRVAAPEPQFLKVLRSASTEIGHFYQRALALEKLRESEERFSSTMKLAAIGIAHVEEGGRFRYVNPQLCEMLGYTEQELLAMTVKEVSHPGDANITDELRDQLRSGGIQSFKMEKRYLRKDGSRDLGGAHDRLQARSRRPMRVRHLGRRGHLLAQRRRGAHPVPRDARRPHGVAESRDVHAAARFVDRNGAALRPQVRRAVHRPRPLQGHQRHARPRGRRRAAARDGARVCASACARATSWRASAATSSWCCCRRSTIRAQAAAVARNILTVVMKPVVILGQECRVTASVGICLHPDDGQDDQSLMKNADMAMYLAKEEGKNNFQFFTSRMKPHSIERLTLETNLRRALERNEFSLHYQAKVELQDRARSRASRRCCAGRTPSWARCRRRTSSRSPRRPA